VHQHRGRCCRHRHSGILYLSPVPEHSGTGLGPLISEPNWFRHRNFCLFRYRTDWMPDGQTFKEKLLLVVVKGIPVHVQTAGSGKWYNPYTSIDSCWWFYSCYMTLKNHM
jgi:hypothetical protein